MYFPPLHDQVWLESTIKERPTTVEMADIDVHADEADREGLDDVAMDEADDSGASGAVRRKGRGFQHGDGDRSGGLSEGRFDSVESDAKASGPQKSIEGWIIFVSGVHEEAQEPDVRNLFEEYGAIKNLHLNLDRRTGFCKGYCLIEYEEHKEALQAVEKLNGAELLGQELHVDWAFVKTVGGGGGGRSGGRRRGGRRRDD